MKVWKVAGMILIAAALAMTAACSKASASLDDGLRSLVARQVKDGSGIKNCALTIANGDGSFEWSGASGMATGQAPMTKDTPIYIASITKLYTAAIVMRLCEQGLLALDDPMAKYLPKELVQGIHVYKGQDYSTQITIRQLLSHSSGIADYYDQKGADGKSLFEIFVENPDRRWSVDQTIERAKKDLKPRFPPGERTFYSDTNFQLLGKIIEAVAGTSVQAAYGQLIFQPLGLKHTYLVGYGGDQVLPSALPGGGVLQEHEHHKGSLQRIILGRRRNCIDGRRDDRLPEGPERGTSRQPKQPRADARLAQMALSARIRLGHDALQLPAPHAHIDADAAIVGPFRFDGFLPVLLRCLRPVSGRDDRPDRFSDQALLSDVSGHQGGREPSGKNQRRETGG